MLIRKVVPAMVIGIVFWFLWQGLNVDKNSLATNKQLSFPDFTLNDVRHPDKTVTLADLKGHMNVVHVWATWCSVCIKEHPEWLNIAKKWQVRVIGVAYRDDAQKVLAILKEKGDPYMLMLDDKAGALGLGLGLVGTPETFLVDEQGNILFQHLGPLTQKSFEKIVLPKLQALSQSRTQHG